MIKPPHAFKATILVVMKTSGWEGAFRRGQPRPLFATYIYIYMLPVPVIDIMGTRRSCLNQDPTRLAAGYRVTGTFWGFLITWYKETHYIVQCRGLRNVTKTTGHNYVYYNRVNCAHACDARCRGWQAPSPVV